MNCERLSGHGTILSSLFKFEFIASRTEACWPHVSVEEVLGPFAQIGLPRLLWSFFQVVEPFKCAGHASIFRVRESEGDTEPYVAKAFK